MPLTGHPSSFFRRRPLRRPTERSCVKSQTHKQDSTTWEQCVEAILWAQLAKRLNLPADYTAEEIEEYARALLAKWGEL